MYFGQYSVLYNTLMYGLTIHNGLHEYRTS